MPSQRVAANSKPKAGVEGEALVVAGEGPADVAVDEEPTQGADARLDAQTAHWRQHAAGVAVRRKPQLARLAWSTSGPTMVNPRRTVPWMPRPS